MAAKMMWFRRTTSLICVASVLTGCHKPYIMTQVDYEYYNTPNPVTTAPIPDDPEELTPGGKPRSVADPTRKKDWDLTLEECKRIALQNNKRIAYLGYEPGIIGTKVDTALARFDPFYQLGNQWSYVNNPLANNIQVFGTGANSITTKAAGTSAGGFGTNTTDGGATSDAPTLTSTPGQDLMSLSKRNAAGGLTKIYYDLDYQNNNPVGAFITINPYWRSTAGVGLEQPLLQGGGVEFNRAPILIARANHEEEIKKFEVEVQTMLRDLELAYWDLYNSYEVLYSREAGLEQALATWQIERNKEIAGRSTPADVAQTREQLEQFRAQRITALNDVLLRERELRALMGLPPDDEYRIIPKDEPSFARYDPNWQLGVTESMQFRPDLEAARFAVRAAEIEVLRQRNGLLPDLTVNGTWSIQGLDSQWDQSIDRLTDRKFDAWTLGMRYRRQIGERAANAGVRRAQLTVSEKRNQLRNLEHQALHKLAESYQNIISNYQLILAQKDRREAAAAQLQAREQIYRQGVSTIDLLLQAQTRFADALRDEAQALVDYNKALAEWEFNRGRILTNDNVILAEQRISLASGKLRSDRAKWWDCSIPLRIHPGSRVHGDLGCPPDDRPLYPHDVWQGVDETTNDSAKMNEEQPIPNIDEKAEPSKLPAETTAPAPLNSTEEPPATLPPPQK